MLARFRWLALVGGCLLVASAQGARAQTHVVPILSRAGPLNGPSTPALRIGSILVSFHAGPSIQGAFRFDAGTAFVDDCYDLRWINVIVGYSENGATLDSDGDGNFETPSAAELPAIQPQIGQIVAGGLPTGVGDNKPWFYNEQNWSTNTPAGIHVEGTGTNFVLAPGTQATGAVVTYHTWLVADDRGAGEFPDQEFSVLGGFTWTYTEGASTPLAVGADLAGDSAAASEIGTALANASPAFPAPAGASPSGAGWTAITGATLRDCSECPAPDASEPDDSCASAVVVQPGLHGNRSVGFGNDDFLRVDGVPAGFEIRADLYHDHAAGDIDLFLFDASDCTTPLRFSISSTDLEHVDFANSSASAADYVLQVRVSANSPSTTCNDYLISIEVVPIGIAAFCPGDGSAIPCPCGNTSPPGQGQGCTSSIGRGGALSATGVPVLGADTITIVGQGMPNGPVLYFQGTARVNNGQGVFFGDGLRCVAGSVVRLAVRFNQNGASSVPAGNELPLSQQGLVTTPGPRHYQAWFRDAVPFCTASPFNLTSALTINWRF